MLPNEAGNDPPENQPSPNIDVLVKSVELDLELVPFSSKLSDLPAEPALKGMPKVSPKITRHDSKITLQQTP